MLRAALWRRRGTVAVAVLAVAIGASVASALLHVSADVGGKVTRELRSLGPNLLMVPATGSDGAEGRFLDEAMVRSRLAAAGLEGVPVLYVLAEVNGRRVPVVGADLDAARRMHPTWRLDGGTPGATTDASVGSLMGARLVGRLGCAPASRWRSASPGRRVPG